MRRLLQILREPLHVPLLDVHTSQRIQTLSPFIIVTDNDPDDHSN
jgi:hypothetical protein